MKILITNLFTHRGSIKLHEYLRELCIKCPPHPYFLQLNILEWVTYFLHIEVARFCMSIDEFCQLEFLKLPLFLYASKMIFPFFGNEWKVYKVKYIPTILAVIPFYSTPLIFSGITNVFCIKFTPSFFSNEQILYEGWCMSNGRGLPLPGPGVVNNWR